jgi:hypothetical protein
MTFDETFDRVQRFLPMAWQRTRKGAPITMAVLQSTKHVYTDEEFRQAGQRGWGISFDGVASKMHFVVNKGVFTMFKAGPHVVNLFYYGSPMVEDPAKNDAWLPQEVQRKAWRDHIAVVSFDYLNYGERVDVAYAVVAKLLAELVGNECAAIYMQRENVLIPNLPTMRGELRDVARHYRE